VEPLFAALPAPLRLRLLPFQAEGVRHALRAGGRLLLADEAGTGKTLQALAAAAAYAQEGPLLIVCPSSLRRQWAEEVELWYPGLHPAGLTVVYSQADIPRLDDIPPLAARARGERAPPRVAIVSYKLLQLHVAALTSPPRFATAILDEAHHLRSAKTSAKEGRETVAAAGLCAVTRRVLALTGTPALNRPFDMYRLLDMIFRSILGDSRIDFATAYCGATGERGAPLCVDGGCRLPELHLLLTASGAMLRRLKADVATQLPALLRRVVRLEAAAREAPPAGAEARPLSAAHDTGARKAAGACAWLRGWLAGAGAGAKIVVFAHHVRVMDAIAAGALEPEPGSAAAAAPHPPYVRLDGSCDAAARHAAVSRFRSDPGCRSALISITAGGTGLDLSCAAACVFAELPGSPAELMQAESRVHRRGASAAAAVDVFYLCADGTGDARAWARLALQLDMTRQVTGGASAADEEALPLHAVMRAADTPPLAATQPMDDAEAEAEARAAASACATQPMDGDWPAALGGDVLLDPQSDWAAPDGELYFLVSQSTKRLHVYLHAAAEAAEEAAPLTPPGLRRLCSVAPEQLAAALERGADALHSLPWPLCCAGGAAAREASQFWYVYSQRTPLEQRRLSVAGAPLRLPLARACAELRARFAAAADAAGGFGGAAAGHTDRRRNARLCAPPPPPGSELRFVSLAGRGAERREQAVSAAGVWLCIGCNDAPSRAQHPPGAGARGAPQPTVSNRMELFCSAECEARLALISDPGRMRKALFDLEAGVCRLCGLDCGQLQARLRGLGAAGSAEQRRGVLVGADARYAMPEHSARLSALCTAEGAAKAHLWEADHVTPVRLGGGLCGLENMRTLCNLCHAQASAAFAAERARRRAAGTLDGGRVVRARPRPDAPSAEAAAAMAAEKAKWMADGDDEFEPVRRRRRSRTGGR